MVSLEIVNVVDQDDTPLDTNLDTKKNQENDPIADSINKSLQ